MQFGSSTPELIKLNALGTDFNGLSINYGRRALVSNSEKYFHVRPTRSIEFNSNRFSTHQDINKFSVGNKI